MSTLWIVVSIVCVLIVLLGWALARIAAKPSRQEIEPMPGAPELYFDKKPRGQRIAKKRTRSFGHDGKCCMVRREVTL